MAFGIRPPGERTRAVRLFVHPRRDVRGNVFGVFSNANQQPRFLFVEPPHPDEIQPLGHSGQTGDQHHQRPTAGPWLLEPLRYGAMNNTRLLARPDPGEANLDDAASSQRNQRWIAGWRHEPITIKPSNG
jgi:hypothetical protein